MAGPAAAASLIFIGGRVHTVNPADDVVSALAVGGGRILAVGADADALAHRGPGTQMVELRGRSLLPGFIDAHCHFPSLGVSMTAIDCKAPGMQSIEALQKAVRERAATREPYHSNCQDSGILYWSQADLDDLLGQAHRAGFQCTVHAVGDRAILQTLDALARAQREAPREGLRHRIEHCGICPPDLQARVRAQGIVPAMQPAFFWEFGDGYIRNYGRERADTMFPARSLIAAGVPVAGSSDAPVTHYAPLFGIEQALTRATMDGDVCGPGERVDLATAIRMHTLNGAYAAFEEHEKGSLEPGKLADLVLLGEDLTRVPTTRLRHVEVAMTVVGGEIVHAA